MESINRHCPRSSGKKALLASAIVQFLASVREAYSKWNLHQHFCDRELLDADEHHGLECWTPGHQAIQGGDGKESGERERLQ